MTGLRKEQLLYGSIALNLVLGLALAMPGGEPAAPAIVPPVAKESGPPSPRLQGASKNVAPTGRTLPQILPRQQEVVHSQPEAAPSNSEQEERREQAKVWLDLAVNRRIEAIENIVSLNGAQRERLREKFSARFESLDQGKSPNEESLEDILGADTADVYRKVREEAFNSLHREAAEREVFFLSRKLGLSPEQEQSVSAIMGQYEEVRKTALQPMRSMADAEGRMRAPGEMFQLHRDYETQMEASREQKNEELRAVLTPEQYAAYLSQEANSPERLLRRGP